MPGVGGRRDRRGDAGHDLERDAGGRERLRLLAAAAEDERVAALEAHDEATRAGRARRGRRRSRPGSWCGRPGASTASISRQPGRRLVEQLAADQAVVHEHLGAAQQLEPAHGDQARDRPGPRRRGRRSRARRLEQRAAARRQRLRPATARPSASGSSPSPLARRRARCRRAGRSRRAAAARPARAARRGPRPARGSRRRTCAAAARSARRIRSPSASFTGASSARLVDARLQREEALTDLGQHDLRSERGSRSRARGRAGRDRRRRARSPASPRSRRLRRRVSTLPRRPSTRRSGRSAPSCAVRRVEAVPTRAPCGTSAQRRRAGRTRRRGGPRAAAPPRARGRAASSVVRSLAECTATSIGPSRSASSSSELKTPRPPSSQKLWRRSRSPAVEIGTIATGPSPAARSASAASPA